MQFVRQLNAKAVPAYVPPPFAAKQQQRQQQQDKERAAPQQRERDAQHQREPPQQPAMQQRQHQRDRNLGYRHLEQQGGGLGAGEGRKEIQVCKQTPIPAKVAFDALDTSGTVLETVFSALGSDVWSLFEDPEVKRRREQQGLSRMRWRSFPSPPKECSRQKCVVGPQRDIYLVGSHRIHFFRSLKKVNFYTEMLKVL